MGCTVDKARKGYTHSHMNKEDGEEGPCHQVLAIVVRLQSRRRYVGHIHLEVMKHKIKLVLGRN